jgi:uncharacterized membrane protein HdeD (DUF308 family)
MSVESTAAFGELQKNWGWLLAMGIISVVLGTIGLGMTFALTLASILFFGVLILVDGGLQFFQAFKCKGWKGVSWHVIIALLYVVAGIAIVKNPLFASAVLTLVLAWTIIAVGIVRSVIAFQHRGTGGWVWALLGGIVSILLGIMILAEWPVSGMWIIGLFVAIELIFNGWSQIMLALAAKHAVNAMPATAST